MAPVISILLLILLLIPPVNPLNRLIFSPHELSPTSPPSVTLANTDPRIHHLHTFLTPPLSTPTPLKTGVLSCYSSPTSTITRPNATHTTLTLTPPSPIPQSPSFATSPTALLIALPRPLVLQRLLPQLIALNPSHIIFYAAAKTPRDYYGHHVLKCFTNNTLPSPLDSYVIAGLTLSASHLPPQITLLPSTAAALPRFLTHTLPTLFPAATHSRILLHPTPNSPTLTHRLTTHPATLLTLGPEGGYTPAELLLFAAHGFTTARLGGANILRLDTAAIVAAGISQDVLDGDVLDGDVLDGGVGVKS